MAEAMKTVEDLVRLSSRVVRILGQNPGPYTLSGTNTYLISAPSRNSHAASTSSLSRPSILIDTGEGTDEYVPLLERALKGATDAEHVSAGTEGHGEELKSWVSDIILTHKHHDHVGGLKSVLSLLSKLRAEATVTLPAPRIHKFADSTSDPDLVKTLQSLPRGSFVTYKDDAAPLWPLIDGAHVGVKDEDSDGTSTLQVVHTPGHTLDHICLLLAEEKTLLTGDHVLGYGTTVFEDLTHYMASLRKCSRILDEVGTPDGIEDNLLYPAHGPVVPQGRQMLTQYLEHRLTREEQVLELLRTRPDDLDASSPNTDATGSRQLGSPWKIRQMVLKMYSDYPENLFAAASRGLFLHLRALASPDPDRSRPAFVRCIQSPSFASAQSEDGASSGSGNCPPVPRTHQEWLEVVDLDWCLMTSPSPSQAQRL